MKNSDIKMHVKGKSVFIDDIPEPSGLLHAAIFTSPASKAVIKKLDVSKAKLSKGVIDIFTAKDIPGKNQVGEIIPDQPLLATDKLEFTGQPIALVVGETKRDALNAFKEIELKLQKLEPLTDPREAYKKGELIQPPRLMVKGDPDNSWEKCDFVIEGTAENAGQEHFYLETQGSLSVPMENGFIKVHAGTQGPGAFHHLLAEILDMPMHKIELDIRRLGGAFGGKEANATWTVLSAVAAKILNKPVKLILSREEDIKTTGKRHPYINDFKIGLTKEGKILAYEVMFFQNAGAYADISTPVLERSLLHATSSYFIPNVKIKTACCRTNIVPNTAFRGFGAPQAVFSIESAIYKASEVLKIPYTEIQKKNLIKEGDIFPYGMKAENCTADLCWKELDKKCNIKERFERVKKYNLKHNHTKKGIALIPVCFGISFTQTALNQANSLVHIYLDGSVGVSTGAVEMGQGVNMKIALIAAKAFGIDPKRVKVQTTNTLRVANASPTAASTGADLNGMATKLACEDILKRLKKTAAEKLETIPSNIEIINETVYENKKSTNISWNQLINDAYWSKTGLSSNAYYATPKLYFDREKECGHPFAYHSFGTSLTEVTVDVIRGTYSIDSVDLIHDIGESLSIDIDRGQFEGGIIQGIGWVSVENLVFSKDGTMLSSTNSYKVPDIKFVPDTMNINFLDKAKNPYAVYNSKAVGEPPFMHGIATYFALLNALRSINNDKPLLLSLPMTPEKVFMYIHG